MKTWRLLIVSTAVIVASMILAIMIMSSPRELSRSIVDREPEECSEVILSVEETIGLSLLGEHRPYHLFKRSNSDAKAELCRLFDSDDDSLYWFQTNFYWILGYIGDSKDALRIQNILGNYTGVLTPFRQKKVISMFYSLGLMSRRGISAASKILDEMTACEYWSDTFKWRPDELVSKDDPTAELESLSWVMLAQTIAAKRKDLATIRLELLDSISITERREYMSHRLDPRRLEEEADTILREEQKTPTTKERAMLMSLFEQRKERMESFSEADRMQSLQP